MKAVLFTSEDSELLHPLHPLHPLPSPLRRLVLQGAEIVTVVENASSRPVLPCSSFVLRYPEVYLDPVIEKQLALLARELAESWYQGDVDPTQVCVGDLTLSLGSILLPVVANALFRTVMKELEVVRQVVEVERPTRLFVDNRHAWHSVPMRLFGSDNCEVLTGHRWWSLARSVVRSMRRRTRQMRARQQAASDVQARPWLQMETHTQPTAGVSDPTGCIKGLFFVDGVGNVDKLLPVARGLAGDQCKKVVCVTMRSHEELGVSFRRAGLRVCSLEQYYDHRLDEALKAESRRALRPSVRVLGSVSIRLPHRQGEAYRLIDLNPRVGDWCSHYFEEAIGLAGQVLCALKREEPDIVIVGNECSLPGRCAVQVAKCLGVPTLLVQEGAMSNPRLMVPFSSDRMAVWGQYAKRALVGLGVEPGRLFVTGAPQFDRIEELKGASAQAEVRARLRVGPDQKIVALTITNAWATGLEAEEQTAIIRLAMEAMDVVPGAVLVIRPHPARGAELQVGDLAELKSRGVRVAEGMNVLQLLAACDVLLTTYSTTGLEAMALGKPVIVVNLRRGPHQHVESGAAIGVYHAEDIVPAIQDLLQNDNAREKLARQSERFIKQQFHEFDGGASKRVAALVEEMIQAKRKAPVNRELSTIGIADKDLQR